MYKYDLEFSGLLYTLKGRGSKLFLRFCHWLWTQPHLLLTFAEHDKLLYSSTVSYSLDKEMVSSWNFNIRICEYQMIKGNSLAS